LLESKNPYRPNGNFERSRHRGALPWDFAPRAMDGIGSGSDEKMSAALLDRPVVK